MSITIDKWNVSNVDNMVRMFAYATSFNQALDKWNVSNLEYMNEMFLNARAFNQALDKWNVSMSKVVTMLNMFVDSGLQQANYCKLFTGNYASVWNKFKSDLGLSYTCP